MTKCHFLKRNFYYNFLTFSFVYQKNAYTFGAS